MMKQLLTHLRKSQYDTTRKMTALTFNGKQEIKVEEVPIPKVTLAQDAIVKVTASTVCGSDLHLFHKKIPGLPKGYILGHESVGVIEDLGPEVSNFKKGDRVAISAVLACGQCDYCKREEYSCCDFTNDPNPVQEKLYGHHTSGIFGYSETLGGFDGCQAEFVRVPIADINLFPIPNEINYKQALVVPDIACTGWHGNELADVQKGDTVVIFGCGPVGLMAQMWAKYRGASIVVAIDVDEQRLEFAKKHFGSVTLKNEGEKKTIEAVHKLIPGGPDKVIDCVGFRFPEGLLEKAEFKLGLETDSPNIVNSAIKMVRKNGRVTLIGDYIGYTNHFNIGAMMEKHLTMNGGQLWPHKYQKAIFEAMMKGKVDPSVVFTHVYPLSQGDKAYKDFNDHSKGIIKPLILPDFIYLHGSTFH